MIVSMASEGNGDTNQAFLLWSIPIYSGIVTKYFCYWKYVLGGSWMVHKNPSCEPRYLGSFTLDLGRFKHFFLKISAGCKGFMLAGPQVKLSFSGQSGSCPPWPRCPTTEPPP